MSNFLQLVQDAVLLGDIADSGPSTVSGQVGDYAKAIKYVQVACKEIEGLHFDWKFLWGNSTISTTAAIDSYVGASDLHLWDMNRVFYSNDYLKVYEWEEYVPDTSLANNSPDFAVIKPNNELLIVPTPDAAYTITYDYSKEPKYLSANTDEPNIPSEYHNVIVGKALMLMALHESAPELFDLGNTLYTFWLAELEAKELPRRAQTSGRHESVDITVVPE